MKKSLKKAISTTALLSALTVGGISSINTNMPVHADGTTEVTSRLSHSYNGYPAGTPFYDGHDGSRDGYNNYEEGSLGHPGDPEDRIPKDVLATDSLHTNNTDNSKENTTSNKANQSNSNDSNSNTNTNNSNQYASNSLPQTGENNTGSKACIAGIATATIGFGLASLDMAKKRKENDDVKVHDSIMGNAFTSLGNNLRKM